MPTGQPVTTVAVVGAGLMGHWHAQAARRSGARIVAVFDADPARASSLAGPAVARASLDAALESRPQFVHVCTPIDTHAAIAHLALAAGCHVIVEKPVAPNAGDADALVRAARAAKRLLVPVHQFTYQRGIREISTRLDTIGAIRQFEFAVASSGADRSNSDRDLLAAEIIPHPLSLARYILGVQVGHLEWRLDRPTAGEWRCTTATADGTIISAMISFRTRPTFASCRVLGDAGTATADLFHGFASFEAGRASRWYKVIRPVAVGLGSAGRAVTNLIGRALRGERAYPGLQALCTAAYAAAAGAGPPPYADDEITDVARARDRLLILATRPFSA